MQVPQPVVVPNEALPVILESSAPVEPPQVASQTAAASFDECGVSRPLTATNSALAVLGELPWQALIVKEGGVMSCSGALISDRFVLTVAHCVRDVVPTSLVVRLGQMQLSASSQALAPQEIAVAAVMSHPDFKEGSLFNDVALLMLQRPVAFDQHIGPVCLPSPQSTPAGPSQCLASGWGQDGLQGQKPAAGLNKVPVGLVQNAQCQSTLQSTHLGKYFQLHKSFVCADAQQNMEACMVRWFFLSLHAQPRTAVLAFLSNSCSFPV